jgi:hypothetical protein
MRRLAFAFALLGLGVLAPAAGATTQTAQSGQVSASFSFNGHFPNYSHERLKISQGAAVLYDQPVIAAFCGTQCAPGSTVASQPAVHVVDLESTGQPDVVLDLFSGGAHCCSIEQIFSFDPGTMSYVKTERNFGDPGERIVDLRHNGRHEFLSADDSFAYEFTDYAASGLPIQVLTFANHRFTDVTRSYPGLIRSDAARWLRFFRSMKRYHWVDTVGLIAAWAADEELLGHQRLVNRYLAAQRRAGHLKSGDGQAGGSRFIAKLKRFLRSHGYLR